MVVVMCHSDFRIFVGDLGNEVNDDALGKAFQRYPSFAKVKVRCGSRLSVFSGAPHRCHLLEASCVIGTHWFGPKRQLLRLCAVWLWCCVKVTSASLWVTWVMESTMVR
jgi:RNA recognition motif-containing protein